jgi:hypothetical protein
VKKIHSCQECCHQTRHCSDEQAHASTTRHFLLEKLF